MSIQSILKRAQRVLGQGLAALKVSDTQADYSIYRDDPAGFIRDILHQTLTPLQTEAAESLLCPPYRTLMPSANGQGKTHISSCVAIWWWETRRPSLVISTAPKLQQLKDLLWKEIRRQSRQLPNGLPFCGPRSLRAERAADDFMLGVTARDATGFQGHHEGEILFLLDEATGVRPEFWEAIESMFHGENHAWLCALNPTDTSSQAFREYQNSARRAKKGLESGWNVVRMPADKHPNIIAELKGEPPPVPNAMRLAMFERLLNSWAQLVGESDKKATDVLWPPAWATDYITRTGQQSRWYRPGPIAEARLFALFPLQTTYSVWGDGDWQAACREGLEPLPIPHSVLPEIGVDVARGGDGGDFTAFHIRCGPCSLEHIAFNGQDLNATIAKCRELAKKYAAWAMNYTPDKVTEFDIPIKVDDTGLGGGVTDVLRADDYNVAGVNAASRAIDSESYPRRRDELWFVTAERARTGELDLSRIPEDIRDVMQMQAMAPLYRLDSRGRRQVEEKDITKQKTGRSPDGCFIAGTQILTQSGNRPIEAVRIGEMAWTRSGWRKVVNAGMTNACAETMKVTFSDGSTLTGTHAHPIWVQGRGFTRMDALNLSDTVESWHNHTKQSFSMASPSLDSRTGKASRRESISIHSRKGAGSRESGLCIKPFGLLRMVRSLMGTTFTTKTSTIPIMPLIISNASRKRSMANGTAGGVASDNGKTSTRFGHSRKNGTQARRGGPGTRNMGKTCSVASGNRKNASARSAARNIEAFACKVARGFARSFATRSITTRLSRFWSRWIALGAASRSKDPSIGLINAVPVHVANLECSQPSAVYNLTVDDANEYYANGILCHNCDAMNLAYAYEEGTTDNPDDIPRIGAMKAGSGSREGQFEAIRSRFRRFGTV